MESNIEWKQATTQSTKSIQNEAKRLKGTNFTIANLKCL